MTVTMILATSADGLNERLVLALARAGARGESAYQVAARAGVHPSELSKWKNGRRSPSAAQAVRVADALGEPAESLFPHVYEREAGEGLASQGAGDVATEPSSA